jgi:hypothetical protein
LASKSKESGLKKNNFPNKEGGVEVAENIEAQEVLDAAEDPNETEEVEFEVEETVEEVEVEDADAELALAKADSNPEEVEAEDTSDAVRLEKALGEVKDLVEQAIAKSVSSNTEGISAVSNSVLELEKSMHDKTDQTEKNMHNMEKAMHEMEKNMHDMKESFASLTSRVESLEKETAIKKSGELEYSAPEQPVMRKSLWGGRFLNSAEIFN